MGIMLPWPGQHCKKYIEYGQCWEEEDHHHLHQAKASSPPELLNNSSCKLLTQRTPEIEKDLKMKGDVSTRNNETVKSKEALETEAQINRGKPKQEGVQVDDFDIRSDLEKIQPDPIDIKSTISPENVSNIPQLLRGACTGTLIDASNNTTISGKKVV